MKNNSQHFDREDKIWMWIDIALVAFIVLVLIVAIHFREGIGQPQGYAWVLVPIGLLSWVSRRRFNAAFLIKGILAWGAIFLFLITAYTYRFELQVAGERVLAAIR
ncbi:MAG: hypothetical protein OXF05_03815 [Hyphomicrobiales bacterium]|nr:hypothetical protein [Hyphomicrobiales bacterium]